MLHTIFDRGLAESFCQDIFNGKPITPADGRWTVEELVQLAGTASFVVASRVGFEMAQEPAKRGESAEQREEELRRRVDAAIAFIRAVTFLVVNDPEKYEEQFCDRVELNMRGDRQAQPVAGFKQKP